MTLEKFLAENHKVIRIHLTKAQGSTPRETGANMLVTKNGQYGTIGGGQLEYLAVDRARAMLKGGAQADTLELPLGPEIGQCCGGRVTLSLSAMDAEDRATALAEHAIQNNTRPCAYLLGAGHVARATARLLQFMPVRCVMIDERPGELALCDAAVETRLSALPEADIRAAPPGSAFVVMTHDHALDFLLASAALARGDAAYVGLIGSATKRARFVRFHRSQPQGGDVSGLTCPIGANESHDKRPEVIAAFVAAEIMSCLVVKPE